MSKFKLFVTTAISPMMIAPPNHDMSEQMGNKIVIQEISLYDALHLIKNSPEFEVVGAVGHENTAGLLEELAGVDNLFNRVNINNLGNTLDKVVAIIPNFRADKAREFSDDELAEANFRCFETRPAIL